MTSLITRLMCKLSKPFTRKTKTAEINISPLLAYAELLVMEFENWDCLLNGRDLAHSVEDFYKVLNKYGIKMTGREAKNGST